VVGVRRLRRDFWIYFTGQTISQVGSSFTNFALPLLVFKLTGSPTNLALTTAAEFVPYLLFGLVLGAVVDRVDRKGLMISVDLVRAAVVGVLPALALLGVLRVEEIYAVAFVQATMGILFDAGEFAAVPSLVGRDELVTANARIMATNSAGQIVGPVLAGALVALLPSVAYLLFVDAGTFLISSLALLLIRRSFNDAGRMGEWQDRADSARAASPTSSPVRAAAVGVLRLSVSTSGDRGRGALVSALRSVLLRRRGVARRMRCRGGSRDGLPVGAAVHPAARGRRPGLPAHARWPLVR
jgi:hypothetical protein